MLTVLVSTGGCARSVSDLFDGLGLSGGARMSGADDESLDAYQKSWERRKWDTDLDRMPYDSSDPRTPWS